MRRKFAKPKLELRGKKVFLRPPKSDDFSQFAELMKKSVFRFRGLIGKFNGRKQFNEYLRRCKRDDFFGFLICQRGSDAIVGNINLFHIIRRGLQSATVGYFVGAPFAQQGYATEALQLMLRFAFKEAKLHRVEADIQPHNMASIALVKRAGFTYEGLSRRLVKIAGKWRDHERWAILAEDWQKQRR
jgi:ribosomal-protein-alanine N-acetyltransferase